MDVMDGIADLDAELAALQAGDLEARRCAERVVRPLGTRFTVTRGGMALLCTASLPEALGAALRAARGLPRDPVSVIERRGDGLPGMTLSLVPGGPTAPGDLVRELEHWSALRAIEHYGQLAADACERIGA